MAPKKKSKRPRRDMYPVPDLGNRIDMVIDDTFGVISDTHFGSTHEALEALESLYDDYVARGIEQVFHGGDLVDGENVYRGHKRYLKEHGYEAQANWTKEMYPEREGIKTHIISGNHDLSFYLQSGADIAKYICAYRDDLDYAGMYYARYVDDEMKLDVLHPSGGGYYSKSYGIQKWIRNNEMPETYPDVMVFGHWHQHGYFSDHGIECIMAGNFQYPNEYHIRRGFTGDIGGWIVELDRDQGGLCGVKLEWRKKE